MDNSTVPKFGSFKPRTTSEPASSEHQKHEHSRRTDERKEHSHRHRKDESGRRRHHEYEFEDRKSRHESSHRKRDREPRSRTEDVEIPIATDEFEESDLFIVDRRGDFKNVEYGSLHRYSIPSYYRSGHGKVLGLPNSTKIDRDESNEKQIRLISSGRDRSQRIPRLLTSKHVRSNESKLRFVTHASAIDASESDFTELRPSRKRKRGSESPRAEVTTVDYRSIEGKAKHSNQPHDEDLETTSGSEADDVDMDLQKRQENAVLSKNAKANSTDLNAWLALVEHQAKLVRPGVEPASFTSSERRTLADLRLSILNEAAKHISQGRSDREVLLRATILEGTLTWDSAKRASKWREALAECPNSIMLWTEYLNYIQDGHNGFRYEACKDAYLQCLRMLRNAHANSSIVDKTLVNRIQVYVLLRLTVFIREAGYQELSIGLWQSLLEYHFHLPPRLQEAPVSQRLEAFEVFWESEVPRIGEAGSKGWNYFHENSGTARRDPPRPQRVSPDPNRPYASFAEQESIFDGLTLPASTDDDDATSDPFRCVMFTDISDYLEIVNIDLPKQTLIDALFCFLGLPCMPSEDVESPALTWARDSHIAGTLKAHTLSTDTALKADTAKLSHRREMTETLFDDAFQSLSNSLSLRDDDGLAGFIDRLLEALVTASPENDVLAEFWLAFKLQESPSEAVKLAKRLLKQRSSSLRLYNAYALVETKRGNLEKAQSVWSMALAADFGSSVQNDKVALWHSRLQSQCRDGREMVALKDILTIASSSNSDSSTREDDSGTQVQRLKTKRFLEEKLSSAFLGQRSSHAALLVDCLAWVEYLTNEFDINTALEIYRARVSRLREMGSLVTLELIQQHKTQLIKVHIDRKRTFKPAALRQELEEALRLFQSNSMLLDLHADLLSQDRLRTMVKEQKVSNPTDMSIIEWSFRVAEEVRRAGREDSGSTSNTIRATFSRALTNADSTANHSPALWMMWLRFEHGRAVQLQGVARVEAIRRTKQVFLDGLRSLPWVKQWVIVGMKLLSEYAMTSGEMRQAYEVLVERGLRLRVDIEEYL